MQTVVRYGTIGRRNGAEMTAARHGPFRPRIDGGAGTGARPPRLPTAPPGRRQPLQRRGSEHLQTPARDIGFDLVLGYTKDHLGDQEAHGSCIRAELFTDFLLAAADIRKIRTFVADMDPDEHGAFFVDRRQRVRDHALRGYRQASAHPRQRSPDGARTYPTRSSPQPVRTDRPIGVRASRRNCPRSARRRRTPGPTSTGRAAQPPSSEAKPPPAPRTMGPGRRERLRRTYVASRRDSRR